MAATSFSTGSTTCGTIVDRSSRRDLRWEVAALGAWAALFATAVIWGRRLQAGGADLLLGAVPLFGRWHIRLTAWAIPAALVALVATVAGPAAVRRLRWGQLLVATAAATVAWALVLALVDGPGGVTDPLFGRGQYMPFLPRITDVGHLVRTYVERLPAYPVHVRGHPPGMLLVLVALRGAGLGGAGWAAGLTIAAYAGGVVALLITVRLLAGERPARLAAPFIAFAPAAIFVATTGDAFFAGVALVGVALFTASTERRDRVGDLLAASAGVTLGAALFLSYGLVLVAVPVVVIAVLRQRRRPFLIAAAGVAAIMAAFLAAGFWWVDGLRATGEQYRLSIAKTRPYGYFLLADLAVFGVIVGPATIASLARLGRRAGPRWRVVPVIGLTMLVLADLSGLSKAEVERIWLFLVPPVAATTALLARPGSDVVRRGWLALQVIAGLILQIALRTPW